MNNLGGFGKQYKSATNKFDFYSGSQITVWFGDIMIDDISSIQWSRSQGKRPIYGYASQQFDAVAKGTVLVQGNFMVNFRQRGYLPAILFEIKDLYDVFHPKSSEEKSPFNSSQWPVTRDLISLHLKNGTFGPTTASEIKALGEREDFFEAAKLYEKLIWGEEEFSLVGDDYQPTKSAADVYQSDIVPDGFTILVTYGNSAWVEARTLNDQLQSTTKTLNGVHIIGESQVIQVGGQPILEQYEFIARGSDEYIGTTR